MAVQKREGKGCGVSGLMASELELGKVARLNVLVQAFTTKYHSLGGLKQERFVSPSSGDLFGAQAYIAAVY